ncbi:MAG TPA: SDR family NAD(P)-dependent oxidoreductase, partial [Desulfobacterales bacterium]|nr:SDR family NAD(P)-dependent oxidoreductase [Desulfobacterales bacterium]
MAIVDKVALVLGGIKGIGRAVALDLAGAGARVVTTYWDWPESLPEMQAAFAPFGERQMIRRTNLLAADQIEALVAEAIARFGRLDI